MASEKSKTVRRSVALPRDLMDEALAVAPAEAVGNLNRIVLISLRDFISRRRAEAFAQAMADMAADPAIRSESAAITSEFAAAENDGLGDD